MGANPVANRSGRTMALRGTLLRVTVSVGGTLVLALAAALTPSAAATECHALEQGDTVGCTLEASAVQARFSEFSDIYHCPNTHHLEASMAVYTGVYDPVTLWVPADASNPCVT